MTPEQRDILAALLLLVPGCVMAVVFILAYCIDASEASKQERMWAEMLAKWEEENRAKREKRLSEERQQRTQMAEDARELSERNRVALAHMVRKSELTK